LPDALVDGRRCCVYDFWRKLIVVAAHQHNPQDVVVDNLLNATDSVERRHIVVLVGNSCVKDEPFRER
jgi:hypothetical protein